MSHTIRFPASLLTIAVILSVCLLGWQVYALHSAYLSMNEFARRDLQIARLGSRIIYYDEVLTMTSRVNATDTVSGTAWETRYRSFESKLDRAIADITVLAVQAGYDTETINKTLNANIELVRMENEAFRLVRNGERDRAIRLLFGEDYENAKDRYAEGIHTLLQNLEHNISRMLKDQSRQLNLEIAAMLILAGLLLLIWAYIFFNIRQWKRDIEKSHTDIKNARDALANTLEKLESVNKEMERYNHIVAHDLKEPLRSIHSFAQLIEEKNTDKEMHENVQIIKRASVRMASLIDHLLTLAKASKSGVVVEKVNTNDEVRFITEEGLQTQIAEAGAKVVFKDLPVIFTDRIKFAILVQNLVSNGIKYNRSEIPTVWIEAQENEKEWMFVVRDNGIGIEEDFKDSIFDLFIRLDHIKDFKEKDGSGIGLALCRKLVDKLNGRIWVEPGQGQGSIFTFTVPKRSE